MVWISSYSGLLLCWSGVTAAFHHAERFGKASSLVYNPSVSQCIFSEELVSHRSLQRAAWRLRIVTRRDASFLLNHKQRSCGDLQAVSEFPIGGKTKKKLTVNCISTLRKLIASTLLLSLWFSACEMPGTLTLSTASQSWAPLPDRECQMYQSR